MEQDENPDPHPGRRPRGHLGVRADGSCAGAPGDDAGGGFVTSASPQRWPSYPAKASIQYAAASRFDRKHSGILDHPLEPVIGRRDAPTRWLVTTAVSVVHRVKLKATARPGAGVPTQSPPQSAAMVISAQI